MVFTGTKLHMVKGKASIGVNTEIERFLLKQISSSKCLTLCTVLSSLKKFICSVEIIILCIVKSLD